MFENVGYKNYRQYIKVVRKCLKDNGLFLLHTIGSKKSVITVFTLISHHCDILETGNDSLP
jgi:cyclopropane-fatty-acyl-phospholipid synthase